MHKFKITHRVTHIRIPQVHHGDRELKLQHGKQAPCLGQVKLGNYRTKQDQRCNQKFGGNHGVARQDPVLQWGGKRLGNKQTGKKEKEVNQIYCMILY